VASLSKSLGFGLRLAYVVPPATERTRVQNAIRSTVWTVPPLLAEVATRWIGDGTAERLVELRRREATARLGLAREVLSGLSYRAHPGGYHLWLPLPAPWRSERLVLEAERAGVAVASGEEFRVGADAGPQAVRVALGAAPSRAVLSRGLHALTELIRQGPGLSVI
jgi:DNA-binding transcriptional MocR family regulator